MDPFWNNFILGAAAIDERLSASFTAIRGQKSDADLAGRRLAAWCRASTNGDWTLFAKRLSRDGLTLQDVLPRLATIRWNPSVPLPSWATDAQWIYSAFGTPVTNEALDRIHRSGGPVAFEELIAPVVAEASKRMWAGLPPTTGRTLAEPAIDDLWRSLAKELSALCSPAFFSGFDEFRRTAASDTVSGANHRRKYDAFVSEMREQGIRNLFEFKPVLLRLVAVTVRQWIEATRELTARLSADLPAIRAQLLDANPGEDIAVVGVRGDLSDRHNDGRSVKLLRFSDGSQALYKPKDLRLDVAWKALVDRLNDDGAPIALRAVRTLARSGYGWVEFIDHAQCSDPSEFSAFFRRAGAWLALFHLFVGTDMHEQNLVAAGDHPVPIDLEMLLQPLVRAEDDPVPAMRAAAYAGQRIVESVTMTGLLPSYWRNPDDVLVGSGGLNNIVAIYTEVSWVDVNSDAMTPIRIDKKEGLPSNLPKIDGDEARLSDFVENLVQGFREYGTFLCVRKGMNTGDEMFSAFQGLKTRRVMRNTRFYYLLLERLRDHRSMGDGAEWSAQLDFVSRFSDWDQATDPLWPLFRSERNALAALCVPHLVSPTDAQEIADASGPLATPVEEPGLMRAHRRYASFDLSEIQWQVEIIRLATNSFDTKPSAERRNHQHFDSTTEHAAESEFLFARVARDICRHLVKAAVRSGIGASWIGLDWIGHSGLCRTTTLGEDLYSGAPGVCLFLAASARLGLDTEARDVSLAGLSAVRHNLRGANSARFARALGVGGATGLGSLIYALTAIATLVDESSLREDALRAASLVTDDLIAADRALDVFDGSAGCILGLLKLFEVTGDTEVLARAVNCGEHILQHPRLGPPHCRSWLGGAIAERAPVLLARPLNGMSHGAAGFAYALASLAQAAQREDFLRAAEDCVAFENDTFSEERNNWPDFRLMGSETEPAWLCQWCHGAAGIGLARLGMLQRTGLSSDSILTDVHRAIRCVTATWPYSGDTLCCGNLGNIELLLEASRSVAISGLGDEASRRLAMLLVGATVNGEYVFDGLDRRFNLGLFRGLAGVGYTCLRHASDSVPNVLIWQ